MCELQHVLRRLFPFPIPSLSLDRWRHTRVHSVPYRISAYPVWGNRMWAFARQWHSIFESGQASKAGERKKRKEKKGVCVGKKDLEGIEGGRVERKDWSKKEEKKRRLLERFHSIFRAALGG